MVAQSFMMSAMQIGHLALSAKSSPAEVCSLLVTGSLSRGMGSAGTGFSETVSTEISCVTVTGSSEIKFSAGAEFSAGGGGVLETDNGQVNQEKADQVHQVKMAIVLQCYLLVLKYYRDPQ